MGKLRSLIGLLASILLFGIGCGSSGPEGEACTPSAPKENSACRYPEKRRVTVKELDGFEPFCESNCSTGGRVSVREVGGLENLEALSGFESFKYLAIRRNPDLVSLDGLEELATVVNLRIQHNPKLKHLEGLGNLTTANGGLKVSNNSNLDSLSGLDSLVETGSIDILGNQNLESVEALDKVRSSQHMRIINIKANPKLESLAGFADIEVIEGELRIWKNDSLRAIEGFESLKRVTGRVKIVDNPELPRCEIDQFIERIQAGGVVVSGNGQGDCSGS